MVGAALLAEVVESAPPSLAGSPILLGEESCGFKVESRFFDKGRQRWALPPLV